MFGIILGLATIPPPPSPTPHQVLQQLIQKEDTDTLLNREDSLKTLFTDDVSGQAALAKAQRRMAYIKAWAAARGFDFKGVTVTVRTGPPHWINPHRIRIYGAVSARYTYNHRVGNKTPTWFGLGVYHWYTLQDTPLGWRIADDLFIDPLNQETRLPGSATPAPVRISESARRQALSRGAQDALNYAAQYCGAAPGCGNQMRYNPKFEDYNWNGGDCSNFISQVLKAGGFAETSTWKWDRHSKEGSPNWVNATRLAHFLTDSGRAQIIAHGTFAELAKPVGPEHLSAIHQLQLGDLISYYERHRTVHFAIVAGFDPDGYPLVISHSADRFREPWDLGWDRSTIFYFYRVNYPKSPSLSTSENGDRKFADDKSL